MSQLFWHPVEQKLNYASAMGKLCQIRGPWSSRYYTGIPQVVNIYELPQVPVLWAYLVQLDSRHVIYMLNMFFSARSLHMFFLIQNNVAAGIE